MAFFVVVVVFTFLTLEKITNKKILLRKIKTYVSVIVKNKYENDGSKNKDLLSKIEHLNELND